MALDRWPDHLGCHGTEIMFFNVRMVTHQAGAAGRYPGLGFITGRVSPVVDLRAKELGIEILYQGSLRKQESYEEIKRHTGPGRPSDRLYGG